MVRLDARKHFSKLCIIISVVGFIIAAAIMYFASGELNNVIITLLSILAVSLAATTYLCTLVTTDYVYFPATGTAVHKDKADDYEKELLSRGDNNV